jgi:hypothetical protein
MRVIKGHLILAESLHRVRVKQYWQFASGSYALYAFAYTDQRLTVVGARFIVYAHYTDQNGVRLDGCQNVLCAHLTATLRLYKTNCHFALVGRL